MNGVTPGSATLLEEQLKLSVQLTAPGDEPVPVSFPKPLSVENAFLIDSIITRYVSHDDQPIVVFSTDEEVTLRIPRIKRVFAGAK